MLKSILSIATAAVFSFSSGLAQSQTYPTEPVKIIVGFPPGGTTDVVGRLVAKELSDALGVNVFVENRPGASGMIGAGIVANAKPDGYTLALVPSTHGTAPALYRSMPYQDKDLVPVALVASTPYVFVVHPSTPVTTFPEVLDLLRKHPGKYNFASSSPGTAQHLGGELLKRSAGVDMVHIPYKGSGALMPDLLAGRVQMMFENIAIMIPHIQKDALRPLAISSAKRSVLLPEIPTVAESGLPGFEVLGWFALLAPASTPPEVLKILNAEVNKLIVKPSAVARFAALGAEPLGGTSDDAKAFIAAEQEKWGKIIRDAGITVN